MSSGMKFESTPFRFFPSNRPVAASSSALSLSQQPHEEQNRANQEMELDAEPTNGATTAYPQAAATGGKELDRTSLLFARSFDLLMISLFRSSHLSRPLPPLTQSVVFILDCTGSMGSYIAVGPPLPFQRAPLALPRHTPSARKLTRHDVLMHWYDFQSATKNIELIVNNILASERENLDFKMGLVHYRSVHRIKSSLHAISDACDDTGIIHRKTIPTLPDYSP